MSEETRRDLLGLSSAGLAVGAAFEALPDWGSLGSSTPGAGQIAVRVTDEKRRFESAPSLGWRRDREKPTAEIITLNPEKKFQEILGFGAAFADASCYMFNQLSAEARERLFHELFHPSALGPIARRRSTIATY